MPRTHKNRPPTISLARTRRGPATVSAIVGAVVDDDGELVAATIEAPKVVAKKVVAKKNYY